MGNQNHSEDIQDEDVTDDEFDVDESFERYRERQGPISVNKCQNEVDDVGPILTGQNSEKIKASLGILLEKGICEMSASASLQVLPSDPSVSATGSGGIEDLPQSAKDIYYQNYGKDEASKEFFNDQWYYVELHQSVLQESSQID